MSEVSEVLICWIINNQDGRDSSRFEEEERAKESKACIKEGTKQTQSTKGIHNKLGICGWVN